MDNDLPYRTEIGDRKPSVALVEAIAEAGGRDPLGLDIVLHEHVNADALDAMFAADRRGDSSVRAEVPIGGYSVTIDSDGSITVDKRATRKI